MRKRLRDALVDCARANLGTKIPLALEGFQCFLEEIVALGFIGTRSNSVL